MEEPTVGALEFTDPLIGRVLSDRYRVLRVIGSGGMGVVYLAEHVLIRRKVAIKLLQTVLKTSEEALQRFHREARAAAAIGNQHIVDVTDMGRLDDGGYYIVLEYLEGKNLAELVESEGPLSIERAAHIGAQICDALSAVHAAGIVHRDLKPENIFLTQRGGSPDFVKLLDFGICKVLDSQPLTATGIALGTPRFMSPEQLEARPDIDLRADIYALGAILFFVLTGKGPFDNVSLPRMMMSVWSDPPPRLRSVRPAAPPELEALIERALAKRASERFPNSAVMANVLRGVQAYGESLTLRAAAPSADAETALLAETATTARSNQEHSHIRLITRVTRVSVIAVFIASAAALFLYWMSQSFTSGLVAPRKDSATTTLHAVQAQAEPPAPEPGESAPAADAVIIQKPVETKRTRPPRRNDKPAPVVVEPQPSVPAAVDSDPRPAPPKEPPSAKPLVPPRAELKPVF